MNAKQEERLIVAIEQLALSFDRIALSLEGIYEASSTTVRRLWPERERREAVVSKHLSEEERRREQTVSTSDRPVEEWLGEDFGGEPEEFIGQREREYLKREAQKRDAGSQTAKDGGQEQRGSEKAGSKQ